MGSIRVAIVGVGNCAASLVQGVEYYRDADPAQKVPGLMHVQFGDYHVRDVEFVAAFDVDAKKVGLDLADAIGASENNTIKICDVPPTGVTVQRGHTLDGLGKYYRETITESDDAPVDIVAALRDGTADVLVCYLPVGSEQAAKFYAQCAHRRRGRVRQRPAGLHRRHQGVGGQVHRGRRADRRRRHQVPGRRHHHAPRAGQAVRGPRRHRRPHVSAQRRRQHGLQEHARARAPGVQEDLQDPVGHLAAHRRDRRRATSTSARRTTSRGSTTASGRSSASRAAHFGDVPLSLEYKLEVWDSPNSAGIIIDALRAAKIAKDRGIGGPILSASSYFMKSPPEQYSDDVCRDLVEQFIAGDIER